MRIASLQKTAIREKGMPSSAKKLKYSPVRTVRQWHQGTNNPLREIYTAAVPIAYYISITLTTRFIFCLYAHLIFIVDYCTVI